MARRTTSRRRCASIATYDIDSNLITANGSNDIIDPVMKSLLMPDEKIAVWTPTYHLQALLLEPRSPDGRGPDGA